MKTESFKSLPELTVKSRKNIWRVAEQARLGLGQAQRKCLIDDPFQIDSGGRCLDADLAKTVSIDYARAYFEAIAVEYLSLRRPYRRLGQLLTIGMKFVYSETNARWKGLGFDDRMRFESLCMPEVRTALLDRKDQLLAQSLQPQKAEERPRPRGFLEKLSPQDPYYKVAWQYHHENLADSHALEAEVHAGRATFNDFIDACVHDFNHAAQAVVAIRDEKSINMRCRKLDNLAKQFIRKTTASIAKQTKRLGKRKAEALTRDFSGRILEISARSKQQIHENALAELTSPGNGIANPATEPRPTRAGVATSETTTAGTTMPPRLVSGKTDQRTGPARQSAQVTREPDFWRARRTEFDALLARQRSMLGRETREEWLKAYCDFSSEHGEFGRCQLRGGFDGRLISDFEDIATQAANALGCPPGVDPTAFWLYHLAKDLLKVSNRQIRKEFSPGGEWGATFRVCWSRRPVTVHALLRRRIARELTIRGGPTRVSNRKCPLFPSGTLRRLRVPVLGKI